MAELNVPNYMTNRPESISDLAQGAMRMQESVQNQKLNEMKMADYQQSEPMRRQLEQAQVQEASTTAAGGKQKIIGSLATNVLGQLDKSGITDPTQRQQFISKAIDAHKPYLQNVLQLPVNDYMSEEQLRSLAGPSAADLEKTRITNLVAEQTALQPGKLELETAKYGGEFDKAKKLADYNYEIKKKEEAIQKPMSEFQQYTMQEKKDKKASDAMEAVSNIDDTIGEFEALKKLQSETTTGPVAGSDAMVALRKALPGNIAGGKNLQSLEKGYNTLAVKAIGAFKAGGVSFGQLSNAEGAWIKSTQASLNADKEVNEEQLNHGLKLLNERKARIEKTSGLGVETPAPKTLPPEAEAMYLKEWNSLPSGAIFTRPDGIKVRKQ